MNTCLACPWTPFTHILLTLLNCQGEWRETGGKKKKRSNPPTKTEPPQNNVEEKPEKSEPTFERDRPERGDNRPESSSRRGRRFDTRPPRLARGRGRERGDGFRGNRDNNEFEGKENGFGTFDKDRDTDSRGRGRGRGRGKLLVVCVFLLDTMENALLQSTRDSL